MKFLMVNRRKLDETNSGRRKIESNKKKEV